MTDRPWTKSYPDGVRWDVDIAPEAVTSILNNSVARWPDAPAIEFMGKRMSYAELGTCSDRVARGLQDLGVGPGVHVGLYLPNSPHCLIAFFGGQQHYIGEMVGGFVKLPNPAGQFQSVHFRHQPVCNQHIDRAGFQHGKTLLGTTGSADILESRSF